MIDVLATLCLLADPTLCAGRAVPVGAATCDAALAAAAPRLAAWERDHRVSDVRCGALPAAPLPSEEAAPGVFVHVAPVALTDEGNGGDIGNVAFVVGRDAVAVVDAGGSRAVGEAVVAAVRARTDLPIRWLVLTHFHPDHVLGATAVVDAGARVVGHERLGQAMAAREGDYLERGLGRVGAGFVGSAVTGVDRAVADRLVLDLGGRRIEVRAWPTAHTEADVTAQDDASGLLVAGDLIFADHVPTLDGSLGGWQGVLGELAALPASGVVPGHGGAVLPWPDAAAPVARYLGVLEADVRAALDAGLPLSEAVGSAAASERGSWALFDDHNPRNATVAYTELEWE